MTNPIQTPAPENSGMTADSVGRDLLQALVQEIKLLPDVWPKMPKAKQDEVIDRLRERVLTKVTEAVHLIAADGRTVVCGELEKITIKDGVQSIIKFSSYADNIQALYESVGNSVLVVMANPEAHTGGMDEIKGEADQRAMDLGHEYDPHGDGKGMDFDEDGVIDVIAIEHKSPKPRTVKYRHPESGQTWSGTGLKPKWVTQWIEEEGGTLADIEVKNDPAQTA